MPELFTPFLFLHVLGAIVALGPALAFPVIGAMGGREPQHANFATRVTHALDDRVVLPVVLSTAVTGIVLIWAVDMPLLDERHRWLLLSVVLYVAAMVFSWFVQRPTVLRVIELTGGFPDQAGATTTAPAAPAAGPAPVAGRAPLTGPAPVTGPASVVGPAPGALASAVGRSQRNGAVLAALSIAITFLMVVKPALGS